MKYLHTLDANQVNELIRLNNELSLEDEPKNDNSNEDSIS